MNIWIRNPASIQPNKAPAIRYPEISVANEAMSDPNTMPREDRVIRAFPQKRGAIFPPVSDTIRYYKMKNERKKDALENISEGRKEREK